MKPFLSFFQEINAARRWQPDHLSEMRVGKGVESCQPSRVQSFQELVNTSSFRPTGFSIVTDDSNYTLNAIDSIESQTVIHLWVSF
ncbi:MAG: hypothetical protein WBB19_05975 [Desulforhopalus sp.]